MGRYSRGPGQASEFARLWNMLPPAQQTAILDQVRTALRVVKNADSETTHGPLGTSDRGVTHSHSHHLSGDRTHQHQHTHYGDSLHIGHDHSDLDAAVESAQTAKQAGARTPRRIMNSAQQARLSAAWERAARTARASERGTR